MPESVADELAKLVALRDSGVLNEEEFDRQKARLLAGSESAAMPSRMPTSPQEAISATPAPAKHKRYRALWEFLALVVLIVVMVVISNSGSSSKPLTHAAEVSAFNRFIGTVNTDLNQCTVAAASIQVFLGLLPQNSSSISQDLVTLDTDSKNAQTACDQTSNNDILNLGTMSVPGDLSGLQSLKKVPIEANGWATNDTTRMLRDVWVIAESSGVSASADSQLQIDTSTANLDANKLNLQLAQAARQLGISKTPSIGLVTWG